MSLRTIGPTARADVRNLDRRLDAALCMLGQGPVDWGMELAASMTEAMLVAVPELGVPDVELELHRESVAVVLGSLRELHIGGRRQDVEVPEVLLGPSELVSSGIGLEYMLCSIRRPPPCAGELLHEWLTMNYGP